MIGLFICPESETAMNAPVPFDPTAEETSVFVAVVGRPNVGKSSLVNCIVGEKVAIVTSKPQTTRTRITGILTVGLLQYVFLDTPGVHKARTKLGERMVKASNESVSDGDAVMMLFEPYGELNESELAMMETIRREGVPALAVINKTDTLKKKEDLLPRIKLLQETGLFEEILPVCTYTGDGKDALLETLKKYAAPSPHYFPDDSYTDMPEKALVAEILREKMLLNLRDEIPHGIAVTVERFREREDRPLIDIDVNIYCEKKSHKGMIIGKEGRMLKKIASEARADCEEFLDAKINLQCWVKIKDDWRDNDFLLNNFGFQK